VVNLFGKFWESGKRLFASLLNHFQHQITIILPTFVYKMSQKAVNKTNEQHKKKTLKKKYKNTISTSFFLKV